ncbi:MAG: hypothetical protein Q9M91_07785 [Candidatus Dojkabacteria bacterium]|nr:hypothetical protein [Candidatus Dojkabacteria bacterium]MDQ7021686.1 hypothetical protein [Candidatus Dojkabacteria bacterium]
MALVERNKLLLLGVSGIIGGFLYKIDEGLPYFFTGTFIIVGGILILILITEPPIDSEKFSLRNYIKQNREGIKQIKHNIPLIKLVYFLIIF